MRTRTMSSVRPAQASRSVRSCATATSRRDRRWAPAGCSSTEDARYWSAPSSGVRGALHDAGADEIQLTAVAARLGGDSFELDADGRLLAVRPGRPRSAIGQAPLVGRSDELARLQAAFDLVVATGEPHHAVVVGEAGIGKSRLVGAFVEDVPAVVLQAACIPYGQGISFLPLRELAERAAELDQAAPSIDELASADAAFAAARTLIEHFTADCPVVVVLDDVHWAVPTFLDVVEYLVRAAHGPLLVISMARPELLEHRPAWGRER